MSKLNKTTHSVAKVSDQRRFLRMSNLKHAVASNRR